MKYELDDEHRTPEWYRQAGESMQKKANYLKMGIYQVERMLMDPERILGWTAKKQLTAEKRTMDTALKRIEETYKQRCIDLREHPESLQAFKDGYLGL